MLLVLLFGLLACLPLLTGLTNYPPKTPKRKPKKNRYTILFNELLANAPFDAAALLLAREEVGAPRGLSILFHHH